MLPNHLIWSRSAGVAFILPQGIIYFTSPSPQMSMCCIFGVCIPYSALWPIVLLFLRQIYTYFYPNHEEKVKGKKASPAVAESCCSLTASTYTCDGDVCVLNEEPESSGDANEASSTGVASPQPTEEPKIVEPSLPLNYKRDMDWENVIGKDKTTIFRFTAKWCKPCKGLDPFYDQMSLQNTDPEVVFYNVDVDEHDEIAALNGALSIPLFVSYRAGEQIGKLSGSDTKKITTFVHDSITCSK